MARRFQRTCKLCDVSPLGLSASTGYLRFEGKDEEAKRVVKRICDSNLKPIAIENSEGPGNGDVVTDDAARVL